MTIDVTTITVAQFQSQFIRGFPYLPVYSSTNIYNKCDETYYNGLFYKATINGVTNVLPGSSGQWEQVEDDIDNWVQNQDISNAFLEAQTVFNNALYGDDNTITLAYLYLTAHIVALSLKAGIQGVSAQGAFAVNSRSVAGVSEAYDVPEAYKNSEILNQYTTTAYGMRFLNMTTPALKGNIVAVCGQALP